MIGADDCAYCGEPAEGNHSVHRDGMGEGPEVPLCDAHGAHSTPRLSEIYARIQERMAAGVAIGVVPT